MRGDPRQVAEAVVKRREGSRNRAQLDDFLEILKDLSGFLELDRNAIYTAMETAVCEDEGSAIRRLVSAIGLNPSIRFAKYVSDRENLVHVLSDPCSCAVWGRFCDEASKDPSNQTVLFFTLKGGIKMVITNFPVKSVPGEIHHVIKSASPDIPDVYIFRVDQVEKFLYQQQLKG